MTLIIDSNRQFFIKAIKPDDIYLHPARQVGNLSLPAYENKRAASEGERGPLENTTNYHAKALPALAND